MNATITKLEDQIHALKDELTKERQSTKSQPVEDYVFNTSTGQKRLSDFFGGKDDLLLIHNMGRACNYCSLWADTLTGYAKHIQQRSGLVLVSPDSPEKMAETATRRGWNYPLATDPDGRFSKDMGYFSDGPEPGVSAFHKNSDGTLARTGTAVFGPGDDFCPIWHLFDLFSHGANGWEPK